MVAPTRCFEFFSLLDIAFVAFVADLYEVTGNLSSSEVILFVFKKCAFFRCLK